MVADANKSSAAREHEDDAAAAINPDTFTAHDLLTFEMLNIHHKPKTSQTATPNNTPLGEWEETF